MASFPCGGSGWNPWIVALLGYAGFQAGMSEHNKLPSPRPDVQASTSTKWTKSLEKRKCCQSLWRRLKPCWHEPKKQNMFLTGSDFSGETFKLSTQASFRIKRDLEVKEQYAIPGMAEIKSAEVRCCRCCFDCNSMLSISGFRLCTGFGKCSDRFSKADC